MTHPTTHIYSIHKNSFLQLKSNVLFIGVVVIICCLISLNLRAQTPVDFVPPSPESSSLIKEIEIGNNYSSGSPKVQIPLYTIQGDRLNLPITASYTTTGTKVSDEASRLGLGWNLNAAGQVTRNVRGIADESLYTIGVEDDTQGGGGTNYNITGYIQDGCEDDYLYSCDQYPDEFYYSIPGGPTGKFTLDQDGNVVQMPYNNVVISYEMMDDSIVLESESYFDVSSTITDRNNDPDMIVSFEIKDENGKTYTFDKIIFTVNNKYQLHENQQGRGFWVTDTYSATWKLTKIHNVTNNEEITFEYEESGRLEYPKLFTSYNNATGAGSYCNCPSMQDEADQLFPNFSLSSNNSILKTIYWRYGKIEFENEKRLDILGDKKFSSMNVYDLDLQQNYNYRSGYDFIQDYFTGPSNFQGSHTGYRLKLNEIVQLKNKNGLTSNVPGYLFDYYDDNSLPHKTSVESDLWGYFNGNSSTDGIPEIWYYTNDSTNYSISTLPRNNGDSSIYVSGANRQSSVAHARTSALKEVVYPTGGKHTLNYELHKFKYDSIEYTGGGIRLFSISIDDDNGNLQLINYSYMESDSSSSGYAHSLPSYANFCTDFSPKNQTTVESNLFRSSTPLVSNIG